MKSMVNGRYINVDVVNKIGGYQKSSTVSVPIFYHRNGHYVRPNKIVFMYLDFKKDVDPNVHVKVFNFVVKTNVETSEKYIINVFNYMLKYTTSYWCHNYILKFLDYVFWSLHKHFANVIKRFKMMRKYM